MEEIKQELEKNNVELARRLVERLVGRAKNQFTPAQSWRAQALLAGTYHAEGDYEKAGRLLVDATALQPDAEKARAHEAAGYDMLGERARAHELAGAVLTDHPESTKALAVWIHSHPDPVSPEELGRRAGRFATTDTEVAVALAARLMFASLPVAAEPYARAATELDPDAPHGWLFLAQALHQRCVTGAWDTARLKEAEALYGHAAALAKVKGPKNLLTTTLTNRAIVREQLGEHDPAEEDYQEVIGLEPADADGPARYSAFLGRRGQAEKAIRWAGRAVELGPTAEHEFLLAAALYERDQGGDRTRALETCRRLVTQTSGELLDRAVSCTVMEMCQLGRPAEARAVLDGLAPGAVPEVCRLTLLGRIASMEGDREQATNLARAAVSAATPETSPADRLSLASLFARLDLDSEAITLLEPAVQPGRFDQLTRLLLDCATRSGRDDLVLRLCRELREAGGDDRQVVGHELDLLSSYDPKTALGVARDDLASHPADRVARLRVALLEDQCEEPDRVPPDLGQLPTPAEAHPATVGAAVLNVLARQERWQDAVTFAYGLYRSHPDDPDANHAFISMVLTAEQAGWRIEQPEEVGPHTAVRYREVGSDGLEALVIEPDAPNPLLGEFAPTHPRVAPVLGKRPGERFLLAAGIQDRYAEVVEVQSKFVFRFQECFASYQTRFRDRRDLQSVRVIHHDPDGTERVDLEPIFRGLDQQTERVEQVLEWYRGHPTPIHVLATILGRDLYETMFGLCSPGLGVRCWDGHDAELRNAAAAYAAGTTLVIEPTAVFTLARLELLDRVADFPGVKLAVTPSTFNLVRNLATDHPLGRSRQTFMRFGPGRYGIAETPAEEVEKDHQFRQRIADWVRAKCLVLSCLELAALEPEKRRMLIEGFGREGAESACVATRPSHLLWTDDATLAVVARGLCPGVRRTWTQAVLIAALDRDHLNWQEVARASAKLIGWEYGILRFGPAELHEAAAMAEWSKREWPFAQALWYFRRPQIRPELRMATAAGFLARITGAGPTEFIRQAMFGATLSSMPRDMVKSLAQVLGLELPDHMVNAVQGRVLAWLRQSSLSILALAAVGWS